MCTPIYKVKTKGSQKVEQIYLTGLQSVTPSYFEHVDIIHYICMIVFLHESQAKREKMTGNFNIELVSSQYSPLHS